MCGIIAGCVMFVVGFMLIKGSGGSDDAAVVGGIIMVCLIGFLTERNTEDK